MQALDGKIVEAEDQSAEADEKALTTKSEWENKDLDWKGRHKEWGQKLKKESRNLAALEEARGVIKVLLLSFVCVDASVSLGFGLPCLSCAASSAPEATVSMAVTSVLRCCLRETLASRREQDEEGRST
jgi:hypothetical protein